MKITSLPFDVLLLCMPSLDATVLCGLARVCRDWKDLPSQAKSVSLGEQTSLDRSHFHSYVQFDTPAVRGVLELLGRRRLPQLRGVALTGVSAVDLHQVMSFLPETAEISLTRCVLRDQRADSSSSSYPSLRSLTLSSVRVTSWNILLSESHLMWLLVFPNLTHLSISSGSLSRLPPAVEKLAHLQSLTVFKCHLSHLCDFARCSNLTELDLSQNNLSGICELDCLTNLRKLNLSASKMPAIDALSNCTALTELSISGGRQLENLGPLALCTRLTRLSVYNSPRLEDLSGLADFRHLQVLNASHSLVRLLTPLTRTAASLCRLSLCDTRVADLSPLQGCSNLAYLDVSRAKVTSLRGLSGCPALRILALNNNCLLAGDLCELAACSRLQRLAAQDTMLASARGLAHCKELEELDLSRTHVSDVSDLVSCPKLLCLGLSGTPIATSSTCSGDACLAVVRQLSSLVSLTLPSFPGLTEASLARSLAPCCRLLKLEVGGARVVSSADEQQQPPQLPVVAAAAAAVVAAAVFSSTSSTVAAPSCSTVICD